MPLHDWATVPGWDGVHQVWIVELLYWLKANLPASYRAYIGTTPSFSITSPAGHQDVGVRTWRPEPQTPAAEVVAVAAADPNEEVEVEMAVGTLPADRAVFVAQGDRLVAAIELVSLRNKDRVSSQDGYTAIYASYLIRGVNLMLVDVHRRPLQFSFADRIATELEFPQWEPCPAPFAVGYRVGEEAPTGGKYLGLWRRALTVGEPLPSVRLSLSVRESVPVDLELTYNRAADAAYLT